MTNDTLSYQPVAERKLATWLINSLQDQLNLGPKAFRFDPLCINTVKCLQAKGGKPQPVHFCPGAFAPTITVTVDSWDNPKRVQIDGDVRGLLRVGIQLDPIDYDSDQQHRDAEAIDRRKLNLFSDRLAEEHGVLQKDFTIKDDTQKKYHALKLETQEPLNPQLEKAWVKPKVKRSLRPLYSRGASLSKRAPYSKGVSTA